MRKPTPPVRQRWSARRRGDQGRFLEHHSIRRSIVRYMLVALGAFVLWGVVLAVAQRQAALRKAVRDAEVITTQSRQRVAVTAVTPPA